MAGMNDWAPRRSLGSLRLKLSSTTRLAPVILAVASLLFAFGTSAAGAASASIALLGGPLAPVSVGVGQSVTFVNPTDLVPISTEVSGVTVTGTVVFSATLTFADRPGGLIAPGESVSLPFQAAGSSTYSYSYGFDIVGIDAANVGVPLDEAYTALTPIAAALPLPPGGSGSVSALAPPASTTSAAPVPSAAPSIEVSGQPTQSGLAVGEGRASGPPTAPGSVAPTAVATSTTPSASAPPADSTTAAASAAASGTPRGAGAGAAAPTSQQGELSLDEADSSADVAAAAESTESNSTGPIAILAVVLLAGVSTTLLRFYILARGD